MATDFLNKIKDSDDYPIGAVTILYQRAGFRDFYDNDEIAKQIYNIYNVKLDVLYENNKDMINQIKSKIFVKNL